MRYMADWVRSEFGTRGASSGPIGAISIAANEPTRVPVVLSGEIISPLQADTFSSTSLGEDSMKMEEDCGTALTFRRNTKVIGHRPPSLGGMMECSPSGTPRVPRRDWERASCWVALK